MCLARSVKILLVGCVGIFGLLTGIDNIIDYPTNFTSVQHVLSMDAIPRTSPFLVRAITGVALQRVAYWLIIGTEVLYGAFCVFGAVRLLIVRRSAEGLALLGLGLGFALYFFGFLIVGGEWFQMWQAGQWNEQQGAFRFLACIGLVLIFVALPEAD